MQISTDQIVVTSKNDAFQCQGGTTTIDLVHHENGQRVDVNAVSQMQLGTRSKVIYISAPRNIQSLIHNILSIKFVCLNGCFTALQHNKVISARKR